MFPGRMSCSIYQPSILHVKIGASNLLWLGRRRCALPRFFKIKFKTCTLFNTLVWLDYIYIYTHYIYIFKYIYIYIFCLYIYIYTYLYTYVHTYLPKYIHTHTYTYIHIHTHTHTHTYTYIHIHIHTYTYIYILRTAWGKHAGSSRSPHVRKVSALIAPRSRETLTIGNRACAHKFIECLQDRQLDFARPSQPDSLLQRQNSDLC